MTLFIGIMIFMLGFIVGGIYVMAGMRKALGVPPGKRLFTEETE